MPLGQFLRALAAAEPAPSGGGAAALSVALAASLCAMTAGLSGRQLGAARAGQFSAEARQLSVRAAALIQADADGYQGVLDARRRAAGGPDGAARTAAVQTAASQTGTGQPWTGQTGAGRVTAALSAAAAVPMQIVELAGLVARLAARLAADGNPSLRGDAITAALLAEAGARAAAVLIDINLAGLSGDDRPALARQLVSEISGRARSALGPAAGGSGSMIVEC